MDGCVYRTKDGECDLYSEGGKFHAWCDLDNCDGRKMSNADRIRAMSDEELAKYLAWMEDEQACYQWEMYGDVDRITELLDWLREEGER